MKKRVNNCLKRLKELNIDALLIADPLNIAYLTGFNADNSYLLLVQDGKTIYFTNFLYREAAKKIKDWELVVSSKKHNIFALISEKVKELGLNTLGFEAIKLPFLEYKVLKDYLSTAVIDIVETKNLVEEVRMIKDKGEILHIMNSIRTSAEAFGFAKEIFNPAMSEREFCIEIEKFLYSKNIRELAFPTIVASGKNTAFPHHEPGDKKLSNEIILIDLGSKHCGYCADLTRVFFWGKMPTLLRKIYDTVRKAQELGIRKIRDGVKASEVDRAARTVIDKKGWGRHFGHGLGHGVGLAVHEPPTIGPDSNQTLKEGMVVTIEPAIYLNGKFGIRLEEMILVKKEKGEVLSGNFYR